MKRALLLPVLVLLVALLVSTIVVGVAWLTADAPGGSLRSLSERFPPLLLAALFGACVLVCPRVFKRPLRAVPASLLLLMLLAAAVFGLSLLPVPVEEALQPARGRINPGTIYQGDRFGLLVTKVTGAQLDGLVLVDSELFASSAFSVAERGYWDRERSVVTGPASVEIPTDTLPGFGSPGVPMFVRSLGADLEQSLEVIGESPGSGFPLSVPPVIWRVVLSVMFSAAAMGLWTGLHLSRWPLINLVVVVAYLRLVVAVPGLVALDRFAGLLERYLPSWLLEAWPLLGWATLALLSLIVASAVPSLAKWRHNMGFQEAGT